MAFNDTLFQLGMDLTRSSTAQKEDFSCVESDAETVDRSSDTDFAKTPRSAKTGGSRLSSTDAGRSLSIDLNGAKRLDDVKSVERSIGRAVDSLRLKLSGLRLDRTAAGDVSGGATLASGQISLRTCARSGQVMLDALGCAGLKPELALIAFADAFGAREAVIMKARRPVAIMLPTLRIAPEITRMTAKPRNVAKAA